MGYADDSGILFSGKYEEIRLPDLLHIVLIMVRIWYEQISMVVNPYAEGMKLLDVYIEEKLNSNGHLYMQSRKLINIFMQYRSAFGRGWGLELQKVLWRYEAALKPKLSYAALV